MPEFHGYLIANHRGLKNKCVYIVRFDGKNIIKYKCVYIVRFDGTHFRAFDG